MNKLICIVKGIIRTIKSLAFISGHDFVEIYNNKDIQILKCEVCNKISLGFKGDKK